MNCPCITKTKDTLIKVHEKGRQAIVRNPKQDLFIRAKVDGCLLTNKTASDWVIAKPKIADVVIELKGCDVDHAVEQIAETISFWNASGNSNGKWAALVVCSRYPKVDTKIQRARVKLAKQYKAPLHVVTQNTVYDFDALLSMKGPFKV